MSPKNSGATKQQQEFASNRAKELVKIDMAHIGKVCSLQKETIRILFKEFLQKSIELAKSSDVHLNFKCGMLRISSGSLQWTGNNVNDIRAPGDDNASMFSVHTISPTFNPVTGG